MPGFEFESADDGGDADAADAAPAVPERRHSLLPGFGPISLPGKPHLPDLAALAASVREALQGAVRDAIEAAARFAPTKCPDGGALVKCGADSCEAAPCGDAQVCVPDCGSCASHKCVDVALPLKVPDLPKLPSVQLPKLPKFAFPKPPCANNEAMNLVATLKTIPATLMMSQSKRISISCSYCPNGTVSKQPALTCTLCLPGTYADRGLSVCRKCLQGYYTSSAGADSCSPCPAGTMAPLPGAFFCIPCPPGFTTNGKKAQRACAFDAGFRALGHPWIARLTDGGGGEDAGAFAVDAEAEKTVVRPTPAAATKANARAG
ncbi:MAG: hypothetical protein J3K34DRAFT_445146 [Monoraphidium minutum]|nr:MAG: hypothetical protein J3K34DRAFT_445146 [Monoraphidium minutum]